jgi:SPP1 family predicted phage head-tail adaptor
MRAGRLEHQITIETPTEQQNELGEVITEWITYVTAWAQREDLTGRELFQALQHTSEVTTRFRIRYVPGISAKMRIISGGREFDIKSVADETGKRRELTMLAKRSG